MASQDKNNQRQRVIGKTYKELLVLRRKWKQEKEDAGSSAKDVLHLSETVLNGFHVLWKQNILCDVILICQRRSFDAHRLLLVTCSDYFYDVFVDNLHPVRELDLTYLNINPNVLENIIQCMYTGKINVSDDTIEEILSSASRLGFYLIQDACEEFLIENTSLRNCLKMLERAFMFNLNKLAEKSLELAAIYFKVVSRRTKFKEMPVEQMVTLLKRDDLNVDSELDVFRRIVEWIEHKKQERLHHAANLMATVRLPLLTPAAIVDSIETVSYLMDIPECQKLVKEALHYHCIPSRQTVLQSPRTIPRNKNACHQLIVIGGAPRLKCDPVSDDVIAYSSAKKSWESLTKIPEPRHHHACIVFGGFLYIAGGERANNNISPLSTVYRFDPRNGTWLQIASMNQNRQSFSLAVLNNMMYAIGGRLDMSESLSSVERYNPQTNVWEEVAPLSTPKRCVAVASFGGRIYAAGGSGNRMISSRVESYSPIDNSWDIKRPMSTPRFFANLIPVAGSLFLIGGATINQDGEIVCVDSVDKYNPYTDCWTYVTKMKTPRAEFGCTLLGDKIYVLGGYNWSTSERLVSVDYLDLDTLIWTKLDEDLPTQWTGLGSVSMTTYNGNTKPI